MIFWPSPRMDYPAVQPEDLVALLSLGQLRLDTEKCDGAEENFLAGLKAGGDDVREKD
jgi:hypothetical protein